MVQFPKRTPYICPRLSADLSQVKFTPTAPYGRASFVQSERAIQAIRPSSISSTAPLCDRPVLDCIAVTHICPLRCFTPSPQPGHGHALRTLLRLLFPLHFYCNLRLLFARAVLITTSYAFPLSRTPYPSSQFLK